MIFYFLQAHNSHTVRSLLEDWAPGLQPHFRVVTYADLDRLQESTPAAGTYIFSDIELLSDLELETASSFAQTLRRAGCRVLNDPKSVLTRFPLLKTLHKIGINDFDVYETHEIPRRFPVFIRRINDHKGSLSDLLDTCDAVEEQLDALRLAGVVDKELMLTEYIHTADSTGMYRKYSCFLIGDSVVPRHLFFSRNWVTKLSANEVDSTLVQEEIDFVDAYPHPHEELVRRVFGAANINYGRIDYSFVDERIQVWEINTNPTIMSIPSKVAPVRFELQREVADRIARAFTGVDDRSSTGITPVAIDAFGSRSGSSLLTPLQRWWRG